MKKYVLLSLLCAQPILCTLDNQQPESSHERDERIQAARFKEYMAEAEQRELRSTQILDLIERRSWNKEQVWQWYCALDRRCYVKQQMQLVQNISSAYDSYERDLLQKWIIEELNTVAVVYEEHMKLQEHVTHNNQVRARAETL